MSQGWISKATGSVAPAVPVVFFPGWGFSGAVLSLAHGGFPWIAPATPLDAATALSDLASFLNEAKIERVRLVGWSLGAHLALDFANCFPARVASLALLAMRESWPAAEIAAIRAELHAAPQAFVQDFYRKCFLGYKAQYRRFLAEQQEELLKNLDLALLERGLNCLAVWQLPEKPPSCPVLSWHGRRDLIAPVTERAHIAGAESRVLDHAGHAIFLEQEFFCP